MPAERGVLADGVELHPNGGIGRHGAGDHPVAVGSFDRSGLSRDHRLVEVGAAVHDQPVGRHSSSGPDEHDVTHGQVGDGDRFGSVVGDPLGGVGQQLGERGERALGLTDRLHLLPVSEEHDDDQSDQLPPEVKIAPPDRGGQRGHVGDGDGQRDQQHHPRLAAADLGDATGEERPSTPEVDDRAQCGGDPRRPRTVDRVPEPVLDLATEDEDRNGEREVPPEQTAEHLGIMACVFVVAAVMAVRTAGRR